MPAGDVCHVMPLGGPANGCRCQSVRWCLDSPAPPSAPSAVPGLPCREPCLPAPAVRPWCSGRISKRTPACSFGAGAPAVARRGAGSVWNAFHGTARPARPDIGGRHPQASRSRPGRATGHPRAKFGHVRPCFNLLRVQEMPSPRLDCHWQRRPCHPSSPAMAEEQGQSPSKAASRPDAASSGLALYWPRAAFSAKEGLLIQHQGRAHPASTSGMVQGRAVTSLMGTATGTPKACPCPRLQDCGTYALRSRWCQNSVRAPQGWHGANVSQRRLFAVVGRLHGGVCALRPAPLPSSGKLGYCRGTGRPPGRRVAPCSTSCATCWPQRPAPSLPRT